MSKTGEAVSYAVCIYIDGKLRSVYNDPDWPSVLRTIRQTRGLRRAKGVKMRVARR